MAEGGSLLNFCITLRYRRFESCFFRIEKQRAHSLVGRASPLHGEGHRFDPDFVHNFKSMNSLFFLFSTGAWVSATLILRSKNPVHAVFYLVLVFLHASGLLCLLGLEYFALLQLLVYVGALAIMFLFVVMLLDIPATEVVAYQRGTYPAAGLLLLSLGITVWLAVLQPSEQSPWEIPLIPTTHTNTMLIQWDLVSDFSSPVVQLGVALYGVHVDLLILASLVLLVAMIGAVALTLKRRVQAPIHDIFAQHNRDFQKVICQIRESSICKKL